MDKKPISKNTKSIMIVFSIALLILSFSITVQYSAQQVYETSLQNLDTDELVTMVISLTDKQESLSAELDELSIANNTLDSTETLENQINQLSLTTGTTDVCGPGISITITADSPIISYDIIDILNELKVSGAEAVAINDHRISYTDRFANELDDKGNTIITLNGEKLLTPIIITAIGDPEALDKGLNMVGGIIENLNTLYNVYPQVKQEELIIMPKLDIATPSYKKSITNSEAS